MKQETIDIILTGTFPQHTLPPIPGEIQLYSSNFLFLKTCKANWVLVLFLFRCMLHLSPSNYISTWICFYLMGWSTSSVFPSFKKCSTRSRENCLLSHVRKKTLIKRFELSRKVKGNLLTCFEEGFEKSPIWFHTIASETFPFNGCIHRHTSRFERETTYLKV